MGSKNKYLWKDEQISRDKIIKSCTLFGYYVSLHIKKKKKR